MHMDAKTDHAAEPDSLWILGAMVILWLVCAVGGLFVVWAHDNGPGKPATAESEWPANTSLERADGSPDARAARASAVHLHARHPRRVD